mmetsp:Transcript_32953/g.90998  ORF Transcript_32953/g.90998 Transcript_32953/m.90998 type:complete len:284 (-) Transcript_32953:99-950(-)
MDATPDKQEVCLATLPGQFDARSWATPLTEPAGPPPAVTGAALLADEACAAGACALSALQRGAGRGAAGGGGRPAAEVRAAGEELDELSGAGDGGGLAVRLVVSRDNEAAPTEARARAAALVQAVTSNSPIPTTDGRYPETKCLQVTDSGNSDGTELRYKLQVSQCLEGTSTQLFEIAGSAFRILWHSNIGGTLCLTSFTSSPATLVGFGPCNSDIDSINNFNQTFQRTGYSMGPICQCRCIRYGPCPIPCSDNAACLHVTEGNLVSDVVLQSRQFFWNVPGL